MDGIGLTAGMKRRFQIPVANANEANIVNKVVLISAQLRSVLSFLFFLSFSFAAAMASFVIQGFAPDICVKAGILAAQYSLQSQDAIAPAVFPENFTPENVEVCIPWDAKDIDIDIS